MISVCMATYNGEKFVRQQLRSITAQLGTADEIIVSDDGSTDPYGTSRTPCATPKATTYSLPTRTTCGNRAR